MKILSVFGTRPEAIKLAPVVKAIEADAALESVVCVTGQHREMLDQALSLFDIRVDRDLDVMSHAQRLVAVTASMLGQLDPVLEEVRPDRVLVQGDTNTTFAASLAAHYHRIPVAHVEAGLRTGDRFAPWPEEVNRHYGPKWYEYTSASFSTNRRRTGLPASADTSAFPLHV